MDELIALQAAVRDYFRLEREADDGVIASIAGADDQAVSVERRLRQARRKLQRLAGDDEVD